MKIIDRYVIRQMLPPILLGLLVFTFVLIIPQIKEHAESFIAKGVSPGLVLTAMLLLVPQALALTIPMSLLLGLLIAFTRLSADREFVAMQACGMSLARLLRPVGVISVLCAGATFYVWAIVVPDSNQRFREIAFNVVAQRAEYKIRSRVFFDDFPNLVLWVRDVPAAGGGWNGVFISDARNTSAPAIYLARRGRVSIDRQRKRIELVLEDGTQHTSNINGKYETSRFDQIWVTLDPATVFPKAGPERGLNEMTIAELRGRVADMQKRGESVHNELITIHRKWSIPVACLVFGLIGIALGATNRRDGALGSFALGLVVIFAYYIPMYLGPSLAKGSLVPPWFAAWLPNIVMGIAGILLFAWRDKAADRPLRIPVPAWLRVRLSGSARRSWGVIRILDHYVTTSYGRVLGLSAAALIGIFYISTFLDLSDKVFKGDATWGMLGEYMAFVTPQYFYYVIPLAVLVAVLVTIGVLTKNNELVVMKACGISLYRIALPMVVCAVGAGLVLFALGESVLGPANRRAERLNNAIRGRVSSTSAINRQWVVGARGEIYHYDFIDPETRRMLGVAVYEFPAGMERIARRTFAERASADSAEPALWHLERGWTRTFQVTGATVPENGGQFSAFEKADRTLDAMSTFVTEPPDARFMGYSQLRDYTERLRTGGFDVLEQDVALAAKLAFPFVTIILTLMAVPFAVLTGRGGAMAAIGVGIGLALTYWITISVFAAMGTGGLVTPLIAAWAPNMLFGAAAVYLLLMVRT
jgi:LPS export ABC transporter permease LptF/LPS export ABC transporter permease LptG